MDSTQIILPIDTEQFRQLLRRHGVVKASLFGSFARGDATGTSDVDLLVQLEPGRSLWDLGGLQYDLEQATKRKIDLTTRLNPHFAPFIEPELVEVL